MPLPNPGVVVSVNLSARKTVRKTRGERGTLIFDRGFEGDAHAGDWHRQVSLLGQESIDKMVAEGLSVGPGDFAENITTAGIDLLALAIGSTIKIGDSCILEISQIGKVCHTKCAIYYQAGDCVMPREGLFAVVRTAGEVRVGDPIDVLSLGDGTCDRTPASAIAEFEAEKAAEAAEAAARGRSVAPARSKAWLYPGRRRRPADGAGIRSTPANGANDDPRLVRRGSNESVVDRDHHRGRLDDGDDALPGR
ncbi:MAG: MOSC domain-containing protein [Candidatus Limnocylindrales bacterium]|jgi:MOSC domain-containing protein YiiM